MDGCAVKSPAVAALQPASVQGSIVVGPGDTLVHCTAAIRCYPAIRRYPASGSHVSRPMELASIESAWTMLAVIGMEARVSNVIYVAVVIVTSAFPAPAIEIASPIPAAVVNTAVESDA